MIVEGADQEGARLSIPRPGRMEPRWVFISITAMLWLFLGARTIWADALWNQEPPPAVLDVPREISCPTDHPFDAAECRRRAPRVGLAPGLHEAYIGRRTHHLSELLPVAFPPSDADLPHLPAEWRVVLESREDRQLVAQILRDATLNDPSWVRRDPIIGHPTDPKLADATLMQRLNLWDPSPLPGLPDRSEATMESLERSHVVRLRLPGRPVLFAAPEHRHIVDRAVTDTKRYAQLRIDAFRRAQSSFLEEATMRSAAASMALARYQRVRSFRVLQLGVLGCAAVLPGLLVVGWLRRRRLRVAIGRHHITLGRRRVLWEHVRDLWWHPTEVGVRQADGSEWSIGGLALSPADARALERQCWPLWMSERSERDAASERALGALKGAAPEV